MNNEPVAWITPDGKGWRIRFESPVNEVLLGWEPLYIHPEKTLTDIVNQAVDEFIAKIEKQALDEPDVSSSWTSYAVSAAEMVRIAILRKASEK